MADDDDSITKQILNLILETNEIRVIIGSWVGLMVIVLLLNVYIAFKIKDL